VAVAGRRRRDDVDRLRTELDESRPYLGLAREIHDEVERSLADPIGDLEELADAIARWPREARLEAVATAFRSLPLDEQWGLLVELFDDDELRAALAVEHERQAAAARRTVQIADVLVAFAEHRRLDTRDVPAGLELAIGLFRDVDVAAALPRGAASTAVARRLVLRATDEPGRLLVVNDVFNPANGLYVTPAYDQSVWRAEQLEPSAVVRVGTAPEGAPFAPLVHPGARLDVEVAGTVRRGHLHVGYVIVGDVDLFVATSQKETG
jgi:hypothetical protein